MIYAPLFVVLQQLLSPALSGYATVLAAAVAGAIGATFYGARQLALAATLIGVLCATLLLITVGPQAQAWHVAALASVLGLVAGVAVDFPHRCTANMGRKFIVGGAVGAFAGAVLFGVDLFTEFALPMAAAVAFLVSVTGVLYVTVLDLMARSQRPGPTTLLQPNRGDRYRRHCDLRREQSDRIRRHVCRRTAGGADRGGDHDCATASLRIPRRHDGGRGDRRAAGAVRIRLGRSGLRQRARSPG